MEGVPKLLMLNFQPKQSSDNSDFVLKLRKLIRTDFHEKDELYEDELQEISSLRAKACLRPQADIDGVAICKRYYSQLHFIQKRFKIEDKNEEEGPFAFPWIEVYSGVMFTYCSLQYEMASVLYNIGALHTFLGAQQDRSESEGLKLACTHFQISSWAFRSVCEKFNTDPTTDLSPELMQWLSLVCVAQAQECILEKSILDHRKPGIIAKVGVQVSDDYKAATRKIEESNAKTDLHEDTIFEVVGKELSKTWTFYCQFKTAYYRAIAYYFMGVQAEESTKIGEAIAYFSHASKTLVEAGTLTKSLNSKIIDRETLTNCLVFCSDIIDYKLENAKKENEFINHDKIPEFTDLPELKGASLVKAIGFEVTDSEISGPDIFSRLVPFEAHEASSLYSEEKARFLRQIGELIEEKDSELVVFLSSLNLEEIPNPGDHLALPKEIIECAAGLSAKDNAVPKLTEAMSRIAAVSADVQASLNEIKELLENEDEQQIEYEAIIGKRPAPIAADLTREYGKYKDAHSMALDSNATLHKAIQLNLNNLKKLSTPLDELQTSIPSMADIDEESEASITEMQRIIQKVDEMRNQRHLLYEDLRQDILNDDITKSLSVQQAKNQNELFEREIEKHNPKKKIIQQNLMAQGNILSALTENNANYVETRRIVSDLLRAREEMVNSLVASYYSYDDLLVKAAKGLEFYAKLDTNVTKLLYRVKSVVSVHQEERDAILAKNMVPKQEPPPKFTPYVMPQLQFQLPVKPEVNPMSILQPKEMPSNTQGTDSPNFENNVQQIASSGTTSHNNVNTSSNTKPTLKDYLNVMKETGKDIANASAMIQQKLPQQPVPEKEMSPEQQQQQLHETVDKENSSNQSPELQQQQQQISSHDDIPSKDQMDQHRDWMLKQQQEQLQLQKQQQQLQYQQQQHLHHQQQQQIWYQQQQFLQQQQQQKISHQQEQQSPEKQIFPQQYPSAPIEFSPTKNSSSTTTNSAKPTLKDYLDMMKECKSTPKDVYAVMHNLPTSDEPSKEMENPTPVPVMLESTPDQEGIKENKMVQNNTVVSKSSSTPLPDLETVNMTTTTTGTAPILVSQQPKVDQQPSPQFYQHSTTAVSQMGYFPHHPQQQQQSGFVQPGLSQFPQYHPGMPMYQHHHHHQYHPNWQMQNQSHPTAQNVHLVAHPSPQKQLENRNEAAANISEINNADNSKQEGHKEKLNENVDKEISSDNKQPQISKQEVIPSQQGLLPHQQQQSISKQEQIPSQGQAPQQQQIYQQQQMYQQQLLYQQQQQQQQLYNQYQFSMQQKIAKANPAEETRLPSPHPQQQQQPQQIHGQQQQQVVDQQQQHQKLPQNQIPSSHQQISTIKLQEAPQQQQQQHQYNIPQQMHGQQPQQFLNQQQQGPAAFQQISTTKQEDAQQRYNNIPYGQQQAQQYFLNQQQLPQNQMTPQSFQQPQQHYGHQVTAAPPSGNFSVKPIEVSYPNSGPVQNTLPTSSVVSSAAISNVSASSTMINPQPYYHQNYNPAGVHRPNPVYGLNQHQIYPNHSMVHSGSGQYSVSTMSMIGGQNNPTQMATTTSIYGAANSRPAPSSGSFTQNFQIRPVVPQPGSLPLTSGSMTAPSPSPSPFQPISPAPLHDTHPDPIPKQVPTTLEIERRASLEEMLTDVEKNSVKVLQPKIMTPGEIEEQKLEAQAKEHIEKANAKNPYDNESILNQLLADMKNLEEKINQKVQFDSMWREMNQIVEKAEKKTISIARCYPMKNRVPDVLPFDNSRVELPTTKDDYINASHIRNVAVHAPRFIATQCPTSKTLSDFWTMVWQENVETMICLLPEVDFIYWPKDRKEPIKIEQPGLEITLQSTKSEPNQPFIERIFTLMSQNMSRVVIHLQFTSNHPLSEITENYVKLAKECLAYQRQQRVMAHPVLVHCLAGSGKTAIFLMIASAMAEIDVGHVDHPDLIPDMIQMGAQICQQRKGILKEKEHFKQALLGTIRHSRDILIKKGKLPPDTIKNKTETSNDPGGNQNSDIGDLTSISNQLGFVIKPSSENPPASSEISNSNSATLDNDDRKTNSKSSGIFSPSEMSKFADLSLSPANAGSTKKKITKEDFTSKKEGLKHESNSNDPLSQLDPLWSLK